MIKKRSEPKVNIRRKQCAKNVRRLRKHYDIHTQTKDGQLVDHKKQDGKRWRLPFSGGMNAGSSSVAVRHNSLATILHTASWDKNNCDKIMKIRRQIQCPVPESLRPTSTTPGGCINKVGGCHSNSFWPGNASFDSSIGLTGKTCLLGLVQLGPSTNYLCAHARGEKSRRY